MLSQRRQRISNIVCCQSGYFLTADNIFDIHMLFKRENGRFFTVRSFVLPKKYRPRPHFPLPETINLSSQPPSSSFSFYHSLSRQFEALSPGKAGLLKLRQSYGSSVIKGIELSCPKGLLTKNQTVCP